MGILKSRQAQKVFLSLLIIGLSGCSYAAEGITGFEKFRKFDKIYEPSGVVQLQDERFLVVEDEAAHPVGIFSLQSNGLVSEQSIYHSSLFSWASPNRALSTLEDLEAVTVDDQGRIYAITSHSRKVNGKRADKREQLARFGLDGERVVDFKVFAWPTQEDLCVA